MAVNSTQTRTRTYTRPGRVSAAPLHPAPIAGNPIAGSRPKPSASAAEVVQAYLKVQVAKLRSLEPEVRADEFDSVHQMRVTTRKIRSLLRHGGFLMLGTAETTMNLDSSFELVRSDGTACGRSASQRSCRAFRPMRRKAAPNLPPFVGSPPTG